MEKNDEKAEVMHHEGADGSSVNVVIDEDAIENTQTGKAVWLISMTASMGGFLFGYDTGVISAVLVTLGDALGHTLSSKEQELITSITSGGAFIGAVLAGLTGDKMGRKFAIYMGCVVFVIGAVIQASAYSLAQMTVGRFVVGFGVGSAAMIIPLYIGEIAPAKYRGRLIVFDNLCVAGGQFIAYAIGAGFTELNQGWRYMVGLGAAPAILLACLLPLCPESPRHLISHGKVEQAKKVLGQIFPNGTPAMIDSKIIVMQNSLEVTTSVLSDRTLWWQCKQLFLVPANLRALTCACAVMAISQLGGFNTLMYYSSTIFALVGFDKPVAVSLVVGATNFIFGFACFFTLDKFGRRVVLLISVLGMALTLTIAAIAFHWIPVSRDLVLETQGINWAGSLLLVMIIFYVAFFAGGVAPIGWVGTELLPIEVRALGTMVNTMTCWGCNVIIASTFLSMMKSMTPSGAFGFYAGICFLGWIFIVFCYPEVHGMPLESVRDVYTHGFGVKHAKQLQKEMRAAKIARISGV
ncbi:Myo-inositol transporter [Coleophoma cylindrospora]|uniref:Myo-inositol transporter n=1 Tax=Coleophoma cylindrospora TaxID=1849047 RepID=A0A3D8SG36_9HELO|nr:Myo-inositol transporter [Coleophoma cylindrospora]